MPLIFFELIAVLAPSFYVVGMRICEFFLEHPDLAEDLVAFLVSPMGPSATPSMRLQNNTAFGELRLVLGRGGFTWSTARRMAEYWQMRLRQLGGNSQAIVEGMREELTMWQLLVRGITRRTVAHEVGEIFVNTLGTRFRLLRKRPVVVVPADVWNHMNVHEQRHFEAMVEFETEIPWALRPLTRMWEAGRIEAITIVRRTTGNGYYLSATHL